MFDRFAETSKRVLEWIGKRATWRILVRIALWSTKDYARAEDLVSDTLLRVMNPEDMPWDGRLRFLQFMTFALRKVHYEQMRLFAAQEEATDAVALGHTMASGEPSMEDKIDRRRELDHLVRLYDALSAELEAEDPRWVECLALMGEGLSAGDQATKLGCEIAEVYAMHDTIKRRAKRIREQWAAAEARQMLARRSRARAPHEVRS